MLAIHILPERQKYEWAKSSRSFMAVKYGLLICCLRNETPYKGQKKTFCKDYSCILSVVEKGFFVCYLRNENPYKGQKEWTFAKTIHVSDRLPKRVFHLLSTKWETLQRLKSDTKIWAMWYEFPTKSEKDPTNHLLSTKCINSVQFFSPLVGKSFSCTKNREKYS